MARLGFMPRQACALRVGVVVGFMNICMRYVSSCAFHVQPCLRQACLLIVVLGQLDRKLTGGIAVNLVTFIDSYVVGVLVLFGLLCAVHCHSRTRAIAPQLV